MRGRRPVRRQPRLHARPWPAAVKAAGLPFLPGVQTVSEAMVARASRAFGLLKFFPADAAGGTAWLKAAAAPLAGLRFCPTGGIGDRKPRRATWRCPTSPASAGPGWRPRDAVAAGDWPRIERLAAAAAALKRA